MTPEAQQIAIAEACGWTEIIYYKIHAGNEGLLGTHIAPDGVRSRDRVPNYPHDLNAMHEAERSLTLDQRRIYIHKLLLIFERDDEARSGTSSWHYLHATAAQRAEAFLRTLNLWTP